MTYTEKIVDAVTGEETIREYTKEEIAEVEAAIKAAAITVANEAKAVADRSAILDKLGITDDEAKLLLS